ncbi:chaplin [Streptacidiphilus jeojiensis]
MRQAARRGLLTVMATGSVLASTAGYAYADAGAAGSASDSPGVGSGNAVQVPVDVPVNVCGDTINVVGLLNPAMGNHCGNGAGHAEGPGGSKGSGGGAVSQGGAHHSPGVGSGNAVAAPVSVPLNLCGDSVDVVGAGNSAHGNSCANHGGGSGVHTPTPPTGSHPGGGKGTPPEHCSCTPPPVRTHPQPPPPVTPPATPPVTPPVHHGSPPPPQTVAKVSRTAPAAAMPTQAVLASTGAGDTMLMLPTGAALALGGLLLYRRSRAGQR